MGLCKDKSTTSISPPEVFYYLSTNYASVGDGHTKNTEAFAGAIKACVDDRGGCVIVPAGIWLTGPIQLKSNLHLEKVLL